MVRDPFVLMFFHSFIRSGTTTEQVPLVFLLMSRRKNGFQKRFVTNPPVTPIQSVIPKRCKITNAFYITFFFYTLSTYMLTAALCVNTWPKSVNEVPFFAHIYSQTVELPNFVQIQLENNFHNSHCGFFFRSKTWWRRSSREAGAWFRACCVDSCWYGVSGDDAPGLQFPLDSSGMEKGKRNNQI